MSYKGASQGHDIIDNITSHLQATAVVFKYKIITCKQSGQFYANIVNA